MIWISFSGFLCDIYRIVCALFMKINRKKLSTGINVLFFNVTHIFWLMLPGFKLGIWATFFPSKIVFGSKRFRKFSYFNIFLIEKRFLCISLLTNMRSSIQNKIKSNQSGNFYNAIVSTIKQSFTAYCKWKTEQKTLMNWK